MLLILGIFMATLGWRSFAAVVQERAHVLSSDYERAIREDILLLGDAESQADLAAERLKHASRSRVLAILKDNLLSQPLSPSTSDLRAAGILNAFELLPTLREVAERSSSWLAFSTINLLLPSTSNAVRLQFGLTYQARLESLLEPVAKMAVIDGLAKMGMPLSRTAFENLITDENLHVRISAVENLVATSAQLSTADRLTRLAVAVRAKPYQARLIAIRAASALVATERSQLSRRVPASVCKQELRKDVAVACGRALGGGP